MHVLHLISSLGYGGAERLITDLAPALKRMGVKTSVGVLSRTAPLQQSLEDAGIPIFHLPGEGTVYDFKKMLNLHRATAALTRQLRADVVHTHLYLPDLLALSIAPASRHVSTLHNVDAWWRDRRAKSWLKTRATALAFKLRKTVLVAVAEDVREAAAVALRTEVNSIRLINNGIIVEKYEADRTRPVAGRIVQVGRFYPQKSHATAIRAFAELSALLPNITLDLIGDGPLRAEIISQVERYRLSGRVNFLGNVSNVASLLSQSDIFWMPSQYEGFSIACAEAIASGLPIVATDVPGLRTMIDDGVNGFLVPFGDSHALAERTRALLSSPELMRQISAANRSTAISRLGIETCAKKYFDVYREVTSVD